jgi:hypothetical protein
MMPFSSLVIAEVANGVGPEQMLRHCLEGHHTTNSRHVFISGQKRGVFGTIK